MSRVVPPPPPDGVGDLLGREAQQVALAGVLARAGRGRPATAVLLGGAGFGKTALLDALVADASARGWRCLRVGGVESESALAGAGLLALLTPLRDHFGRVPGAQAEALGAALGWTTATADGDRFLVGAGTLSLLAAAASGTPLLVAVDDVQWVDVESAQALVFAARRLGHDRVALVVSQRSGTELRVPLDGFEVVPVDGLPAEAARALLGPGFGAAVVDLLVTQTQGNPLALQECRRTLSTAERSGAAPLPPVLPVPDRLRDLYVAELSTMSPAAWRLVVLAAASTDQAAAPVVEALRAEGLDPEACLAELRPYLMEHNGSLQFRHPLVRAAAWVRASPSERRGAHRALARTVDDRAARVWHLADAALGVDDDVADELEAVARCDRLRRGHGAAAAALTRSARLTADPGRRAHRLAAATQDAQVAGDAAAVRRLAQEVLASDAGPEPRARVLVALGLTEQHYGTMAGSRRRFEEAAGLATGRLLVWTLCQVALACHFVGDLEASAAAVDRVAAVADLTDPEQAMTAAWLTGVGWAMQGRHDLAAPLMRQAFDLLEHDPGLRQDHRHLTLAILGAYFLTDPTDAVRAAERRLASAREAGALGVLALGLSAYSGALSWAGQHVRAHAVAGEAIDLLDALGYVADPGVACEVAALECAGRGLHEEARGHLAHARRFSAIHDVDPMPPHLARTAAECSLARGDMEEVVGLLEDQLARFGGIGPLMEPLGVAPLLVEAYLTLGRPKDAQDLARRYVAAQAEPAHPYVAVMVARCEAMVATDLVDAEAAFERCLVLHRQHPDGLETARSRLLYGMRLRRGGRRVEARTQLDAARAAFLALDQTLWADRAAQELAATGERRRAPGATREPLTSQETRVALLVAKGLTNREVAAALFLSPRTIEHHLGAVLRKRGLRSRTELARELAAAADDVAPEADEVGEGTA